MKQKPRQFTTVVAAFVAIVMLVAGGAVIASNTGFKLNAPVAIASPTAPQAGNNWTSIPFFNPYTDFDDFCTQTGLPNSFPIRVSILDLDPVSGAFRGPLTCGTGAAADPVNATLIPGRSIRIRVPNNTTVAAPASIIIVGSNNPALSITVPDIDRVAPITAQIGNLWFSVPYHTTAVTVEDLCLSSGLTSAGIFRATVQVLDATSGAFLGPFTCGGGSTQTLTLGQGIRLRDPGNPGAGTTFIPAHF